LDELTQSDDFEDHVFKPYALAVYQYAISNGKLTQKKWWDAEAFIAVLFFVWKADALNKVPPAVKKTKADESKFKQETDAKAAAALASKKKMNLWKF
jgi:hypothetical protein